MRLPTTVAADHSATQVAGYTSAACCDATSGPGAYRLGSVNLLTDTLLAGGFAAPP